MNRGITKEAMIILLDMKGMIEMVVMMVGVESSMIGIMVEGKSTMIGINAVMSLLGLTRS